MAWHGNGQPCGSLLLYKYYAPAYDCIALDPDTIAHEMIDHRSPWAWYAYQQEDVEEHDLWLFATDESSSLPIPWA